MPNRSSRPPRPASALVLAALATLAGCADGEPDAWGSFEAEEVTVSAEVAGPLLRFDVAEGERLGAGDVVGVIDTTQAALQLAELEAQRAAAESQTGSAGASAAALEAELASAAAELRRTERLRAARAATDQQLEQALARVNVLRERIRGARDQASGTIGSTRAIEARIAQLRDRLDRSRIRNPVAGTVLARHVRAGEFVQPGAPLYRIADLDTLVLRAYLSGDQLGRVRIGESVRVTYDAGPGELGSRAGRVAWIAAEAEFTPTPIQTREERADLVYAIEVRVPNADGALKIGMPGELQLDAAEGGAERSAGR